MTTTTDLDALLAAVLAQPDEDTVRLVYADCLDEQGGPVASHRAEFIRNQCEIAKRCPIKSCPDCDAGHSNGSGMVIWDNKLACRSCGIDPSKSRQVRSMFIHMPSPEVLHRWFVGDVAGSYFKQFDRSIPPGYYGEAAAWSRGFVHSITCTAADWIKHADTITAQHPITAVTLTTMPEITAFRSDSGETAWFNGRAMSIRLTGDVAIIARDADEWTARAAVVTALCFAEWPRITFTLPPPEAIWGESPLREAYQVYRTAQQLGLRPSAARAAELLGITTRRP